MVCRGTADVAGGLFCLLCVLSIFSSGAGFSFRSKLNNKQSKTGKLIFSEECAPTGSGKKVSINEMYLVCESRRYNVQGPIYQDTPTCRAGDRAKLELDFHVSHVHNQNSTIAIAIEASFYKITTLILNATNICNFKSLSFFGQSDDDQFRTPPCPIRKGPYQLYTSFTVPLLNKNDPTLDFTPDLQLYFYDGNTFETVGCVETGSLAMISLDKRNGTRGQKLLAISILVLALAFAICFVGHRRRRKAGQRALALKQRSKLRRFHYRRHHSQGDAVLMSTVNGVETEGSSSVGSVPPPEVT